MTIAKLFNGQNVVVGQAACLLAPENTPQPAMGLYNLADPFSLNPFSYEVLTITGATAFTITYVVNGVSATTSSLTVAGLTATAFATALGALANVGAGNAFVSGTVSPWGISFADSVAGGTLTVTPTGGTATFGPALWVPVGATDQGWKFTTNKSTNDITVEEQSASIRTTMSSQKITVEGSLSEDIANTLAVVYNMTQTLVAPATGVPGYTELALTDNILAYALILIMANKFGYPRVLYMPSAVSLSNAETTFRRASAKRMYPAVFSSQYDITQIKIREITAPGS